MSFGVNKCTSISIHNIIEENERSLKWYTYMMDKQLDLCHMVSPTYKYLGVLQSNDTCHQYLDTLLGIQKEYISM